MEQCARCAAGPEGLEGHAELTLHHRDQPPYGAAAGHHLFRCLACAALWIRYYEGGGIFRWARRN